MSDGFSDNSGSGACRCDRAIRRLTRPHSRRSKNFATLVKEALPAAADGKPIEIWFQDEARIGQKGTLTRLWARIGSRPRAPRNSRYEWAYLFVAVCPQRAVGAALVMPCANTEAMNLHLQEIGRAVAPDAHGILVLDGAGWHTSHILTPPDNLTPLRLPPCSPELNPVENVWEYLRRNNLALRVHETYDAIVEACCNAWTDLIAAPDRVASITRRHWAVVS